MVDDGITEIETPVPTGVPPHEPEYQCHVAPGESVPVNVSVEDPPAEQMEVGTALTAVGAAGAGLTFMTTLLQVEKHPPLSART